LRNVGRLIITNPQLHSSTEAQALHGAIMEFCATGMASQLPQ
jgi:hypothetical protein